jgi:hypothetical protein
VSRWPTAWARCKGNVIDEPTAPQNLELGQIDLIKTEDLSDRWPQGGRLIVDKRMRCALLDLLPPCRGCSSEKRRTQTSTYTGAPVLDPTAAC